MELYFKEIVIEDGYTRFLDHTTQPPFSEDVSKINLVVKDLSNKASQRASIAMQAVVGGDSAMDLRGEMAAIGAPTYVDMTGELRKFALPAANPYMDSLLAWIIRRGDLTAKLEYKIEQDKLDAKNDILVGNLKVAPSRASDEVKKRIGLPLGLIVALIKDGDGNIHVNVPISGTLTDKKFDFSDAIWTAVKNVIINVLKAPFRAIGGLFTSGDKIDELKVDPVDLRGGERGPEPGDGAADGAGGRLPAPRALRGPDPRLGDLAGGRGGAQGARGGGPAREVPEGAGDRRPGRRPAPVLPGDGQGRAAAQDGGRPAAAPAQARAGSRPPRSPSSSSAGST